MRQIDPELAYILQPLRELKGAVDFDAVAQELNKGDVAAQQVGDFLRRGLHILSEQDKRRDLDELTQRLEAGGDPVVRHRVNNTH